ncbi:LysR family transcriptional regulator [Novosphingobium flavum]|uniref:LysR family transcriptional regulator n=1 Tax=Novosphingobium flavum TaxID=1778672 RepID=A0A7X1FS86_9SPHN|nr:LysR family transcriptional regulator [Novosphingobium flavum]MBC2666016.1 LysR family transcriptional regulator [Novosphingobium flavum]
MDRLTTMATFLRVVKCANFTTAAEELSISRTLVSRHVADLEAHLGIKLLNRTTRQVTATDAGLRYAELCQKVLGEIRSGEEQIAAIKNEVEGEISILCPIWIGSFGISPATAEFCKQNPGISIRLHFEEPSSNPHEFLAHGHDLCIQPNVLRDSSIMVKKIGRIEHLLVASPEYLAERGMPETAEDLARHDCLAKSTDATWLFTNGERVNLRLPSRFSSNSVFALREACVAGLGIAMLPKGIMRLPLVEDRLVPVLTDNPPAARPLYVAFPPGDAPRRIKALVSFLADWFKQHSPDEA